MRDIRCQECGEPIESGYAVNPEVSALCNTCYDRNMSEMSSDDL